jgi:hypothetical protein
MYLLAVRVGEVRGSRPDRSPRANENALEANLLGVCMAGQGNRPRALFYSGSGRPMLPDHLVCSGRLPSSLNGKPCPYSVVGRMPEPVPIGRSRARDAPEVGEEGDLAPPCAVRHYGSLADWVGPRTSGFPDDVLALRLFECRQKFLLVVPGIQNERGVTDEVGDVV